MIAEIGLTFILLILFLVVSLIVFTAPGFGILRLFKIGLRDNVEKYTISTIIGLVVFTLSSYLLALGHARFLLWFFPAAGIIVLFKNIKELLFKKGAGLSRAIWVYFLIILFFGVATQVAINAPSGFNFNGNLLFWSAQGRDGMWHIALMEEMKRNIFPFQNPEYSGHILQNYHFFADLLMSDISRMFHFSDLDVYFRFVPVLFSILMGFASFVFVREWTKDAKAGLWGMIFTYFAGSFGYIVTFLQNRTIGGETIFWMNQTPSVLGNPPQAAAFIIVIGFLFLLLKFLKSRKIPFLILSGLLAGTVIEFKVYAGLIIIGSLLLLGIYELIFKKRHQMALLFLASLAISSLLYFPNSNGSGGFIIFQPWWFIRTMVVVKLGLLDWELRRQTYLSVGRFTSYLRILQLEGTAFLIYLIGNLGVRILGFIKISKDIIKGEIKKSINVFIYAASLIAFAVPLLFLQRGVVYNSIQFSQYFLLFFGFVAAVSVAKVLGGIRNNFAKVALSLAVVALAMPTTFGLLWQFYANKPLAKVSASELSAFNFLKTTNANSVILTAPFDKYAAGNDGEPPIPLFDWSDTGYVAALSGRRTLISDTEQIDIMGYDYHELESERIKAFADATGGLLSSFIKKFNVDYLYLNKSESSKINYSDLGMLKVFENDRVEIYQVIERQ
jgi:hypothetical protein